MTDKYIIIKDFLPEEQANSLAEYIKSTEDWLSIYRVEDEAPLTNFRNTFSGITKRRDFEHKVKEAICSGRFTYKQKRLRKQALKDSKIFSSTIQNVFENTEFTEYLQTLIDVPYRLQLANNYFASIFDRGDFLSMHEDGDYELAFILNLSKDWRYEYGGCLTIVDGENVKMILPEFNSLVLLLLKRDGIKHFVTQVSTFAPDVRIAFSGWYVREGEQNSS